MAANTIEAGTVQSVPKNQVQGGLLDPRLLWKSLPDALRKLDPRTLWRNPVMFIVEIGAVWSTILAIFTPSWFAWLIVFWLWLWGPIGGFVAVPLVLIFYTIFVNIVPVERTTAGR